MNEQGKILIDQLTPDVLQKLSEQYGIQNILVFGSVLTDTFYEYSDVDFAILASQPVKLDTLLEIELYLEALLNRAIDVIDLRSDSVDLFVKISALNTGVSLYSVDQNTSLSILIEEIEYLYRNNETFFARRRRDLLS